MVSKALEVDTGNGKCDSVSTFKDLVFDENGKISFPHNVDNLKFLIMLICHAITLNNQLQYEKLLGQLETDNELHASIFDLLTD